MKIYGNSDIGLVRHTNEDTFRYEILPNGFALLVICDGMGGANGGGVASAMTLETVFSAVKEGLDQSMEDGSIEGLFQKAIEGANEKVFRSSISDVALSGMGTTVVLAAVRNGKVYLAHVGDSRAYYVGSSGLRQLTTDHSMVQELVKSGDLTQQQAKVHPQKNIITRAVGVDKSIQVDFHVEPIEEGDRILLCTDGLSDYVEDETIFKLAKEDSLEDCCNQLITTAKENGGGDNITVVAAEYEGRG